MSLTVRIVPLVLLALALANQGCNEYASRTLSDVRLSANTIARARTVTEDLTQVVGTARHAFNFVA